MAYTQDRKPEHILGGELGSEWQGNSTDPGESECADLLCSLCRVAYCHLTREVVQKSQQVGLAKEVVA